jgi:putative heme-binding domain-containing protein
LTGAGGRFTNSDLLMAILDPSKIVSDQYRDSIIETKDGTIVVGRIVSDSVDAIEVRPNPLTLDRERIAKSDIQSVSQISTSSMPIGLLNAHSKEEILDLLAYLRSGAR